MIVGVDLVPRNTGIAFLDGDTPRVIPNDRGDRITPSNVALIARIRLLLEKTPVDADT